MYFTGGFSRYVPDTCIGSATLMCAEYKVDASGTVSLGLRTAEELSFYNVTIDCPDGSKASHSNAGLVERNKRLNGTLALLSCEGMQGRMGSLFIVEYRIAAESVMHTALGEIRATIEP